MSQAAWTAVDDYFGRHLLPSDPVLDEVLRANAAAGLPPHDVSPAQGKLLHLLARMAGARRILEIGTLGGYSTIWLARALPEDGRVVTLELLPQHARVARENFERAGLTGLVDLRVGPALSSLARLIDAGDPPFDFIFIDADKPSNREYLAAALRLAREGAVIVADNVVRGGAVAEAESPDPSAAGVRRFIDLLAAEPRLSATVIQTVGCKGWDGFALARVTAEPPA